MVQHNSTAPNLIQQDTSSADQPPNDGFLRLKAVLRLIPISRSAWWAGVRDGRFPKPVKLGPRTTAWRVCDINDLIRTLADK